MSSKKSHQNSLPKSPQQIATPYASFVGVDLHKCTVVLSAVDPAGEPIERLKIDTKCVSKIEDWLAVVPKPCWMAIEAVGFTEWFIDRFRHCAYRTDMADA